jgi:hypothetical protein
MDCPCIGFHVATCMIFGNLNSSRQLIIVYVYSLVVVVSLVLTNVWYVLSYFLDEHYVSLGYPFPSFFDVVWLVRRVMR